METIDKALRNSPVEFRRKFLDAVNYGSRSKIDITALDPMRKGYSPQRLFDELYAVYQSLPVGQCIPAADLARAAAAKMKRIDGLLKVMKGHHTTLLDLGCGSGVTGAAFSQVVAADYVVLADKKRRLTQTSKHLMFVEMDLLAITPDALESERVPGVYDIVSCFYALHHVDPAALLKVAESVLRDGGYFLCCEYDIRSDVERARATTLHIGTTIHELPRGLTKKEFEERVSTRMHFTSSAELIALAAAAGLKLVKMTEVREDGQYFALFTAGRASRS